MRDTKYSHNAKFMVDYFRLEPARVQCTGERIHEVIFKHARPRERLQSPHTTIASVLLCLLELKGHVDRATHLTSAFDWQLTRRTDAAVT